MDKVERIAEGFAEAVRQAFAVIYGVPKDERTWQSVRPSWSDVSVRQGWTDPEPGTVVVGTEYSWIQDPYLSPEDNAKWDKAMLVLKDFGWGDCGWESINAAVHVVFWRVPASWAEMRRKQKQR